MTLPFISESEPEPQIIKETHISALQVEPKTLPQTKLPDTSLQQARDSYLSLMKRTDSDTLIAESLQRLAEIESMMANNSLDQGNNTQMQKHLDMASQYYQKLLDQHEDKIDKTVIQYQLAKVMELNGQVNSANNILSELANLQGDNLEIIEAGFRMAENAYSQRNYNKALTLYNKVLQHQNKPEEGKLNSFYNAALFKRGWTQFKKQNYDLALNDYLDLLRIIYLKPEDRSKAEATLIEETYRVSALSLSYMEGAKSLAEYFTETGHAEFERELYLTLADMYMEQQRFHDTATTYRVFVESNPLSIHAPEFEHKGIDILSKSGFVDLVLTAKEDFVQHYQTGSIYWKETGFDRNPQVSEWLFENLEDVINFYHAKAQESKQTEDYLNAAKWYRIFLRSFKDHPQASDKRWLLAESLNDAGDFLSSITEYQILAYEQNNLKNSRKEEAAYRVILARQELFSKTKTNPEKEKISQSRMDLIKTALRYKEAFPDAIRLPAVIASTLELQLEAELTEDAVKLARSLITISRASAPQLKRAREIIANGEFDLQNYQLAELAYTAIINQDKYSASKMKEFHQRRAQSIYKQAEQLKEQQKLAEAVEQFLRLTEVEPQSSERMMAEYDAATLLLEIEDFDKAITVLNGFLKHFPKSELSKTIPSKLIVAYEATKNWSGAAKQYEKIAATSKDEDVARTALWQAGINWMKIDSKTTKETAVALWKKYIKTYPKPFDLSLEARNYLINLYQDLNVKWKQDFWRRKIILVVNSNQLKEPRAQSLAANSQLSLANDEFKTFEKIKLTLPLQKSLKQKNDKLKSTLNAYSKVLDYGIQTLSTEAGFRIGQSYALLSHSIMNSERPKGMTEIELEEYDILLEERVFDFEDKAIESLEANVKLTSQGIYDEWIQKSFAELEVLMPARYQKPEVIDDFAESP